MNYGRCEGGPWHQRDMAHVPDVYPVFIDPTTKKPVPGMQAGTKGGEYRFDGRNWVWNPK